MTSLTVTQSQILPDNGQWKNRIEIKSSSSNRVYVVSQNKAKGHWGCSCPGWKAHRTCKHLKALGLPSYEKPFEIEVKTVPASRHLTAGGSY